MKRFLAALAAMHACAAPAFAADCAGAMAERFSLVCRGPLTFEMYQRNDGGTGNFSTEVVYHIDAARQAAGPNGASLLPGRCAWSDRPLNNREPRKLGFVVASQQPASAGGTLNPMTPQMWDNVQTCLGDSQCRVSFCARGAASRLFIIDIGESWLEAFGRYAQIHYLMPVEPVLIPLPEPIEPRPGIDF
ncbi:MAG: hypothetical protein U5J99_01285 [Parvularculaceae bacterium]|nr:hypothetical protein [Parvularculaceae bacterium]